MMTLLQQIQTNQIQNQEKPELLILPENNDNVSDLYKFQSMVIMYHK